MAYMPTCMCDLEYLNDYYVLHENMLSPSSSINNFFLADRPNFQVVAMGRSPQIYTVRQGVTLKNELFPYLNFGKKSSGFYYYVTN